MRSLFLTTFIVYAVLLTEAITFLSHHGSPNSLCSPFMDQSKSLLLVKVHVLSAALIQLLQIFSCIIMQYNTIMILQKSIRKTDRKSTKIKGMVTQLCLLTSFEIFSWVSSSSTHVMCLYVENFPTKIVLYTAILCTPINSIFSPLILLLFERVGICSVKKN